jgi:hypothetical protein
MEQAIHTLRALLAGDAASVDSAEVRLIYDFALLD